MEQLCLQDTGSSDGARDLQVSRRCGRPGGLVKTMCTAGFRRHLLVVINTMLCLLAVALVACGLVLRYFLDEVMKSNVFKTHRQDTCRNIAPIDLAPTSMEFGPLTGGVGGALVALGCFLLVIATLGVCAGYSDFKVFLLLYLVILVRFMMYFIGVLVVAQVIVASVFLPRNSPIHDKAKEVLKKKMNTDYDLQQNNTFLLSSSILFMAAQCCGVNSSHDFNDPNKLNFSRNMNITPQVPPFCCKREYLKMSDWTCTSSDNKHYTQGCYEKLQDLLEEWYPWLIPAIVISLLVQVGAVGLTLLVYHDKAT
ncbi:tetraspanin-9-like [Pomacea canaliculata]|uniref:tetraspanin-9-like n=1 Tax=Pomacea canaliculata TaxID=400727 RepID=UPI000D72E379|nr:tetraspanin-9-like [Pomacea canaliculata]